MRTTIISWGIAVGSAAVVVYGIATVFAGLYPKMALLIASSLLHMGGLGKIVPYLKFEATPNSILIGAGTLFSLGFIFTLVVVVAHRMLTSRRKDILCINCTDKNLKS